MVGETQAEEGKSVKISSGVWPVGGCGVISNMIVQLKHGIEAVGPLRMDVITSVLAPCHNWLVVFCCCSQ